MKKKRLQAFFAFLSVMGAVFFVVSAVFAAPETNRPPQVQPMRAQLFAPVTHYSVVAMDPDNDPLMFSWQGDISCGTFNAGTGPTASWSHPEGNPPSGCPHGEGTSHLGAVTVHVSDGKNHTVVCTYEGSESGNGPLCSGVSASSGGSSDMSRSSYNYGNYSNGNGWILILVAVAFLGWWIRANRLFVTDANDPCAGAREAERAARARRDSAQRDFDSIDSAKKAADAAEHAARDAEKDAQKATSAAGGRWSAHGSTDWEGEHIEAHKEGWQNKELGEKADEVIAKAKDAEIAAKKAKDDFDRQGGSSGWEHAKDNMTKATDAWQKLVGALKVCLDGVAATPKPKPVGDPTVSGGSTGTGTTDGPHTPPSTPGGTTPPPQEKKEPSRVCNEGDRRNARTQTLDVELLDLQSTRLMQDRIYSDTGNEAMKFVDWLQTLKDTFMVGKRLKGGVEGYLGKSLTGTAEAVNLPDFLTWYDEATNMLTQSMHKLHAIMQDKQQLGDYWLEYTTKRLTITCSSYEVCAGNRWVKHCELSIQDNGSHQGRTDPEQVFDTKELQHTISRLFIKLRNRYRGDTDRAKRFTDACNKCS